MAASLIAKPYTAVVVTLPTSVMHARARPTVQLRSDLLAKCRFFPPSLVRLFFHFYCLFQLQKRMERILNTMLPSKLLSGDGYCHASRKYVQI